MKTMGDVLDKALEVLKDDGGIDCIKTALKKAVEIVNPEFEITPNDWGDMFDKMILTRLEGKKTWRTKTKNFI